jgi:Na+/H+-dicarboxylate symporter
MCAQHSVKKTSFWFSTPVIYALMILLGVASGLSDIPLLKSLGIFIADVFIKIFKCISLPIISLSIIVTLASYSSEGGLKSVWRRTMTYTLGTTLVAAALSCLLYLLIQPSMVHVVSNSVAMPQSKFNYFDHLSSIIPSSLLGPFLEQQVMSVLLLGIVIGIAIRFIPDKEPRETITQFFKGAHGLFMVITKWVIAIIPIGLFGFITASVVQIRTGSVLKGIGEYLMVIVLANLIQGLIVLPIWLRAHGIKPFKALKGMLPALSLAFFSKSSVGTLPVTMETAEKSLGVKPEIGRFVLPLCTSINMNGCAAFIFVTVIYLMQNNGIEVTYASMAVWVVVATVSAIGNAGVPMGCFFLSTSLLASMNVPITLMGIILPFFSLIDMLETSLNVWSDACVTKVVDEKHTRDMQGVLDATLPEGAEIA